ncbi:MAG: hypothetical protein ACXVAR_05705 [Vulcanimicrobiaceae bacterium]
MDIVALIAERKIEEAMGNGAFDALAPMGRIDCSCTARGLSQSGSARNFSVKNWR